MKINKTILVTGGTGYIGSHIVESLIDKNYEVIVLDDLSNSYKKSNLNYKFYNGNILDNSLLEKIFSENKINGVIHLAAKVSVSESVREPELYFQVNHKGTKNLLSYMKKYNVENIIFSSTAATYGLSKIYPIKETFQQKPINPYGESKLLAEKEIINSNFNYVIFRYFNVSGANINKKLKYNPKVKATHIIPSLIEASTRKREYFEIYGNDYDTKDGTAIRDYVHVQDLADAHILGLEYILNGNESNIFNISMNKGYSVQEIYDIANKVLKKNIPLKIQERREGDPSILVAENNKIKNILNWKSKYSIEDMIRTEYESQ